MHPILFQIGSLKVYSYGFFIALAILAGTLWLMRKVERKGVASQFVIDFVLLGTVAGIVGARLAYILLYDPGYYLSHPLQIFMLQQGGLAFYGTVLFCLVAAVIYLRVTKIPALAFLGPGSPQPDAGLCHRAHRLLLQRLLLWDTDQPAHWDGLSGGR